MLPPTRRGEGRSGTQRILDARLRGLNVQSQGRCLCGPRCVDQAQDSLDIGSLLRVCQEPLHPPTILVLGSLRQGIPWGIGFVEGDDPVAHADGRRRRTP